MNHSADIATTVASKRTPARRIAMILGSAALLLGLTAPAALAGQPSRQALDIPDVIEIPAGAGCDFAIRLDVLVNREINTTFEARGDETWIRTTGRLVVGVTNEWNGNSVVVNISGPGLTVVHGDGSSTLTFYGKGLPFADEGFFVSSGPVVQQYAPDGSLLSTSTPQGSARDLCSELG